MPYISMFFGIIIRMFYNEHNPPHFHAEYQGQKGVFDLEGNMLRGNIKSVVARKLIKQWAQRHSTELQENWRNIEHGTLLNKIEPLE